jgi:hypothetical protein
MDQEVYTGQQHDCMAVFVAKLELPGLSTPMMFIAHDPIYHSAHIYYSPNNPNNPNVFKQTK